MNRRAYSKESYGHGYKEPRMQYLNEPIMHRSEPVVEYMPQEYSSRYREPRVIHSSSRPSYREPMSYDRHQSRPYYMDDMVMEVPREPVVEREYRQPRNYSSYHQRSPYVTDITPEYVHEEIIQPRGHSSSRRHGGNGGEFMWTSRDKYDRYDDRGYSSRSRRYDDYNGGYPMRRARSDPSLIGGYY